MTPPELVLVVVATYAGAVGYAELFACDVVRVVAGSAPSGPLRLTVLATDRERLAFLEGRPPSQELEVGFTVAEKNVPYKTMPITGFVDENGTAWQVTYLREASAD